LTSLQVVLASLATIRAETAGFVPLDEGLSRFNTSPGGHPFDLYDNRSDLGNQGPPDGASFKGRGFVQLTGRRNYTKLGPVAGVPGLVSRPEQANDPEIAAALLAAFVKAVEIPLKQALLDNDLAAARKLVNGGSHGLADFTDAYQTGLDLMQVVG
jgi:peptidoglycan L-alanyl-D-glutamate endopeptidase CwlK